MEVGQVDNIKVGFVIQARMRSERLQNKVLQNIPLHEKKSLIKWISDQVQKSVFQNNKIIIATSSHQSNDPLRCFCQSNGIECFNGEESDVFSRYYKIAKNNEFDVIVRLTADNPLIDVEFLDRTIKKHVHNNNDYTKTIDLPLGMNFEVINPKALLMINPSELSIEDKEHVTLFFRNNQKRFKCHFLSFGINQNISNLRLTIDYPSDFIVVATVLSLLKLKPISIANIAEIYIKYPWVFDVNKKNVQKMN